MKKEYWDDKDAFDRICGNCYGCNMSEITEDDIREQAARWNHDGDPCSEAMVEAAIRGLWQYQRERAK